MKDEKPWVGIMRTHSQPTGRGGVPGFRCLFLLRLHPTLNFLSPNSSSVRHSNPVERENLHTLPVCSYTVHSNQKHPIHPIYPPARSFPFRATYQQLPYHEQRNTCTPTAFDRHRPNTEESFCRTRSGHITRTNHLSNRHQFLPSTPYYSTTIHQEPEKPSRNICMLYITPLPPQCLALYKQERNFTKESL